MQTHGHRREVHPSAGILLRQANQLSSAELTFLPAPDPLQTAGFDVISGVSITIMGIMISVGAVLVMAAVWALKRIEGRRCKPERTAEKKIGAHYIQTGEVGGACNRSFSLSGVADVTFDGPTL